MVDLLHFVLALAADDAARRHFRSDPEAVLEAEVHDADQLSGEDVVAVAEVLRRRLDRRAAERVEVPEPARPVGAETPADAAVRLLVGLCDALDGPAVDPVPLPRREAPPAPPPPREVARGGGEPVPGSPPGGRHLHPVVPDEES